MARKRSETKVTGWVKLQDYVVDKLKSEHTRQKEIVLDLKHQYEHALKHLYCDTYHIVMDRNERTSDKCATAKAKAAVTTFLKG
jgi:hypothetical protein